MFIFDTRIDPSELTGERLKSPQVGMGQDQREAPGKAFAKFSPADLGGAACRRFRRKEFKRETENRSKFTVLLGSERRTLSYHVGQGDAKRDRRRSASRGRHGLGPVAAPHHQVVPANYKHAGLQTPACL